MPLTSDQLADELEVVQRSCLFKRRLRIESAKGCASPPRVALVPISTWLREWDNRDQVVARMQGGPRAQEIGWVCAALSDSAIRQRPPRLRAWLRQVSSLLRNVCNSIPAASGTDHVPWTRADANPQAETAADPDFGMPALWPGCKATRALNG